MPSTKTADFRVPEKVAAITALFSVGDTAGPVKVSPAKLSGSAGAAPGASTFACIVEMTSNNPPQWRAISDSTVTLLGNATAYGGIGGGFSTLKMTMSLPGGTLTQGTNTISFRFNGTDGRVSGL